MLGLVYKQTQKHLCSECKIIKKLRVNYVLHLKKKKGDSTEVLWSHAVPHFL